MRLKADLVQRPELRAFRSGLSAWLAEHLTDEFRSPGVRGVPGNIALVDPTGDEGADFERRRAWQRTLHSGGWVGVHWPAALGGRSAVLMEHAVYLLIGGGTTESQRNMLGEKVLGLTREPKPVR